MLGKAFIAGKRLLRDQSAQNMIEYALVAALIALAAVAGVQGLAASLSATFSKISSNVSAAGG
jgi:pilus assembly protein Flp/PilA